MLVGEGAHRGPGAGREQSDQSDQEQSNRLTPRAAHYPTWQLEADAQASGLAPEVLKEQVERVLQSDPLSTELDEVLLARGHVIEGLPLLDKARLAAGVVLAPDAQSPRGDRSWPDRDRSWPRATHPGIPPLPTDRYSSGGGGQLSVLPFRLLNSSLTSSLTYLLRWGAAALRAVFPRYVDPE